MAASTTKPTKASKALADLLEMDDDDRVEAIAEDLRSGKDRFQCIDAGDLAEALGVPTPSSEDGDSWLHFYYVEKTSLPILVKTGEVDLENLLNLIEEHLTPERYQKFLLVSEDGAGDIPADFFTPDEDATLAAAYAEDRITNGDREYMPSYSQHWLKTANGEYLGFETELGDWGEQAYFFGPYDSRDGRFTGPPANSFVLFLNADTIEET